MLNIIICDDEKNFTDKVEHEFRNIINSAEYCDFEYNIKTFNNTKTTLDYCLQNNNISLALLDIDMPGLNGFDIASVLSKEKPDCLIIFISNLDNYVYTSLKFSPFRFIRKSCLKEELKEAITSALNKIIFEKKHLILNNKNERIYLSDIVYFESKRNYVDVVLTDKTYTYRDSLKEVEKKYSKYGFIRIHSGYIVNLKRVKRIEKSVVLTDNDVQLPISRTYLKSVREKYAEYLREF